MNEYLILWAEVCEANGVEDGTSLKGLAPCLVGGNHGLVVDGNGDNGGWFNLNTGHRHKTAGGLIWGLFHACAVKEYEWDEARGAETR
jgi:hypothetical protein